MSKLTETYVVPPSLVLGKRLNGRVPEADQKRQRAEVEEVLRRFRRQPGLILADEVGMGKTYVALGVAYSVALQSPRGPVVLMVPANLIDKWIQDLRNFAELYLENRRVVDRASAEPKDLRDPSCLRFGVARHSVELMRLLDDERRERCHFVFLAQGAMGRRQSDKWIRLALIAEALRAHGRGKAARLIQVKKYIHRYLAELVWAVGEQKSSDLGDDLWRELLANDPMFWKAIYNGASRSGAKLLQDDPVPKAVWRTIRDIDLRSLADQLARLPIRFSGDARRMSERLTVVRNAVRGVEAELWKQVLAQARWRSPLLVMDEAHHLKNPGTMLSRQLQSTESRGDLQTGDGALSNSFDRMLFLTATPFQLGHQELVSVLKRFTDVRWDRAELGEVADLKTKLQNLGDRLNESQRTAIGLQKAWSRLRLEAGETPGHEWWRGILTSERDSLPYSHRAVVDSFKAAKRARDAAETALRPWVLRHVKGESWVDSEIRRRRRTDGAGGSGRQGLAIPPNQLLPFFLAARSASSAGKDLLGEALCSSYEAFRSTRKSNRARKDGETPSAPEGGDLLHAAWYLREFDTALEGSSGAMHPKLDSTVQRVADLWEQGEKVLVFAFYRLTCSALRLYISEELKRRVARSGLAKLRETGQVLSERGLDRLVEKIQRRFFDDSDSPGRRAVDRALGGILARREASFTELNVAPAQREQMLDVMRRFLRVKTTLTRCFPLHELDSIRPEKAVETTLDYRDLSGQSWSDKFNGFIDFLLDTCATEERRLFLEAALHTQTGGIRVEVEEDDEDGDGQTSSVTLANVQVATGTTARDKRSRLMRSFNTPFFPDIFVCSEVMGEGVDLQRFCRHVIHHDLAWNPSIIEQRTGRIDRLGCKAEGKHPIEVYLPFLAGTSDERQYRVMSDRERWFRVVMGEGEVARLISPESTCEVPLPDAAAEELSFHLGLGEISQTKRSLTQRA